MEHLTVALTCAIHLSCLYTPCTTTIFLPVILDSEKKKCIHEEDLECYTCHLLWILIQHYLFLKSLLFIFWRSSYIRNKSHPVISFIQFLWQIKGSPAAVEFLAICLNLRSKHSLKPQKLGQGERLSQLPEVNEVCLLCNIEDWVHWHSEQTLTLWQLLLDCCRLKPNCVVLQARCKEAVETLWQRQ